MSEEHQHDSAAVRATTAFIVIIPEDGSPSYISTEFGSFELQRTATFGDMRRGLADALADLNARAAASYTVQALTPSPPPTVGEKVASAVAKKKAKRWD